MGVLIEKREQLSPLAARIVATVTMQGPGGVTFEELTRLLRASKSSISTNLKLLLDLGRISYFTKPGDRKRYFVITSSIISDRIDALIRNWEVEKELHEDLIRFKMDYNSRLQGKEVAKRLPLDIHERYLEFLNGVIEQVKNFKQHMAG